MAGVIINSDDFGYNPEVNKAIVLAFKHNYISSTTTLTNFEEGFADARRIVNESSINPDAIGIHLNLTEGKPLTDGIKSCSRFCDGNEFHGKARSQKMFTLAVDEKKAVKDELNAQIEQFKTLGFAPSHIDSHHHVHTEWGVMNVLMGIADSHNVKKIRLSRNVGPGISTAKGIYKFLINKYLPLRGFTTTTLMGDIDDYSHSGMPNGVLAEIMVHAIFVDGVLADLDGKDLAQKLSKLNLNNILNYSQI